MKGTWASGPMSYITRWNYFFNGTGLDTRAVNPLSCASHAIFNLFVVDGELPQFALIGPSSHLLKAVGRQSDGGPLVGPVSQQIEDGRLLPKEIGAQASPEFHRRLGIRQPGVDENTKAGFPLSVSRVL